MMIEVIDRKTMVKMMALILCKISYDNDDYIVFSVKRDKIEANIFLCKIVRNSQGLTMDVDFVNGEKEVIESVIQRLLNNVDKVKLMKEGFSLSDDVVLSGSQYYDIDKCYVSTVSLDKIKELISFYDLSVKNMILDRPVLDVKEDKKVFNEGALLNIVLIIFGIIVIIFSLVVVIYTLL